MLISDIFPLRKFLSLSQMAFYFSNLILQTASAKKLPSNFLLEGKTVASNQLAKQEMSLCSLQF